MLFLHHRELLRFLAAIDQDLQQIINLLENLLRYIGLALEGTDLVAGVEPEDELVAMVVLIFLEDLLLDLWVVVY